MLTRRLTASGCAVLLTLGLFGCNKTPNGFSIMANNGTALTATVSASAPECQDEESALVTLSGSLLTTGSVDDAVITLSLDGQDPVEVGTVDTDDFVHAGREKTAPFSVPVTLTNGTHTLALTFTQSGAQGRASKQTSTEAMTVTVDCAPPEVEENPCLDVAASGQVTGNTNVCSASTSQLPVKFTGNFGDEATITITGPGGFSLTAPADRAGDSCNYHYGLERNGLTAGTYTFSITGNGESYSFTKKLTCN